MSALPSAVADRVAPAVPLGIGPLLPTFDATGAGLRDPRSVAAQAEDLDFDHVWVGDHLSFHGSPWLESVTALTLIGAATRHVGIGFSVLLPSLRPAAWVAKQVATLATLFPGRLTLGVGVGGEEPAEWAAVGVPVTERGARTDAFLAALPDLLAGREVVLDEPSGRRIPPLRPAVPPPPVWVGGRSRAALRRAVRFGDVWLGAFVDPPRVRAAGEEMAAMAGDDPPPSRAVSAFVQVNGDRGDAEAQAADYVGGIYGLPFERMRRYVILGDEEEVAARLLELLEAGAEGMSLIPTCRRPWTQLEPLAEVRRLVLREATDRPTSRVDR